MADTAKFWDRIAERYAKKPIANEAAYQQKLRTTQKYLEPDMELLEIGCGTGSTALVHASYVKHVRATDISPKMIEIAKGKAAAENVTNVTFDVASMDDLGAGDQSVDVVLALSVLHLLEDRDEAIATVHKVLRRDGLFVSSTVCLGDKMKFFKYIAPVGKFLGLMPLLKVFTARDLTRSLTEAGFVIEHKWEQEDRINVFIVARKSG